MIPAEAGITIVLVSERVFILSLTAVEMYSIYPLRGRTIDAQRKGIPEARRHYIYCCPERGSTSVRTKKAKDTDVILEIIF